MTKVSLKDLQTMALQTAQRFVDYGSYQKSETKAVAALKRRCFGWSKDECRDWFLKAVVVHNAGIKYMKHHTDQAFDIYKEQKDKIDLSPMAGDFVADHKAFPKELLWGF